MGKRDRNSASRELAELVSEQLARLRDLPVEEKPTDKLGKAVFNTIASRQVHTLPRTKAQEAINALPLSHEERSVANILLVRATQRVAGTPFPRRRQVPYRQRHGSFRR